MATVTSSIVGQLVAEVVKVADFTAAGAPVREDLARLVPPPDPRGQLTAK